MVAVCAPCATVAATVTLTVALAVVQILGIEGNAVTVRTVDCLDGTPLIDIKPYYPSTDSVPGARVP